jgi:hypothetical protein
MPSKVIILGSQEIGSTDRKLIKLLKFFGIKCEILDIVNSELNYNKFQKHFEENDACLIINCKKLQFIQQNKIFNDIRTSIFSRFNHVFVYNLYPTDFINAIVSDLTNGLIKSLSHFENNSHRYDINNECVDICRQFSGLSFGPINKDCDFKFQPNNNSDNMTKLISIDGHPYFVKIKENERELFLVANNRIIDIDKKVGDDFNIRNYFSQMVPIIMFIKYVFGDMCWHNDQHQACFIIDDPLLRMNYGFLNYRKLLNTMDRQNFCTNIAFIPYNYKRSAPNVTNLFNGNPRKYTISYHGCNHTDKEFGITDDEELNSKVRLAILRMKKHQQDTNIKCDKIMVFPQGKFSNNSMKILKANKFLAAVSSDTFPYGGSKQLRVSEFLELAIMKYGNFPLFLRKYPGEIADFAFDIFLGKPLLIVEHHGIFKDGYNKLIDFIYKINSLEKGIVWDGLENIIKNTYLKRREADGTVQIKAYTNHGVIKNASSRTIKYYITKYEDSEIPIDQVMIDGNKLVDWVNSDKFINFSVEIEPGGRKHFEILYKNNFGYKDEEERAVTRCGIFLRRFLSEIRDNYVSRSDLLLSMANIAKEGVYKVIR